MPIYEYVCKQCGGETELLVARTDWKGAKCPACGSTRLAKRLSVFAVASGGQAAGRCEVAPACGGNPAECGRCGLN